MKLNWNAITHQSCKACCFSAWERPELAGKATQTGCRLNLIERYRAKNPESVKECFDDAGDEFFVINGRECPYYRDMEWATRQENPVEAVKLASRLRLGFVVLVKDLDDALKTAESILRQQHVSEIMFVHHAAAVPPGKLNAALWELLGNATTWRLTTLFQDEDERLMVDTAVSHMKRSSWYSTCGSGFVFPEGFARSLDRAINEELGEFVFLRGDGWNAQTACMGLHRHKKINGNAPLESDGELLESLEDKSIYLARINPNRMKDVSEVCPEVGFG